jgi:phage replication O-like protein O
MALILKQCWFQCPNEIFDDGIVRELSGNAVKILFFIYRKTFGFHKTADRISYSQITDILGISHRDTIQRAIKELITADLITRGGSKGGYWYAPKIVDETGSKNEHPPGDECSEIEHPDVQKLNIPCSEIEHPPAETGSKNEHTKDSLKDKDKEICDPAIRKMILDRFEQLYKREFNGRSPAKKTMREAIAQNVAIRKLLDSGETPARIMVSLDAYFNLDNDYFRRTIPVFCKHYHDVSELIRARDGGVNPAKKRRRGKVVATTDVGRSIKDMKTFFDD